MAIGSLANMTVFEQQFYGGFIEQVQTKLDVFNAESRGTMNLSTLFHRGMFKDEAFFKDDISVQDRDPTSSSIITPDSISSDTHRMAKLYKSIFVEQSLQSFRNQGLPMEEIAMIVGQKSGQRILEKWRESAINSLVGAYDLAALQPAAADELVLDVTAASGQAGQFTIDSMIAAMPLFGDASNRLRMVVMHSAVYWKLVAAASANLATPATADLAVQSGLPATLGLPILVVDSPALIEAGAGPNGQDVYRSFILAEGALSVEESEAPMVDTDKDLTRENTTMQFKTELAYSVGIKGISYSSATQHPTDAQLATSAVWSKVYTSKRDLPGIMIKSVVVPNP